MPKKLDSSEASLNLGDGTQKLRLWVGEERAQPVIRMAGGKRWTTWKKEKEWALQLGYATELTQASASDPNRSVHTGRWKVRN